MAEAALTRLDGSITTLSREDLSTALGDAEALYPDSDEYDNARAIWNAMIDRRPGLIVRPRTEQEVSAIVKLASSRALSIAAKAGGHNIAGKALADGGLVVDFAHMKGVAVDPKTRIARIQPGATLGDVDRVTQRHGLAVPSGVNSTTGLAGLTLGGGFGWTTRKHGLTIDNLRSVRLVTADGRLQTIDEDSNSDLFWALRGGGGNFGVITKFEFDACAVGPEVLAGLVIHPLEDMEQVLTEYQEALHDAPDEMTCWAVMRKAPPLPFLPEDWHGRSVLALAMCCIGNPSQAEAAASPFRRIGKPVADAVSRIPFVDWQTAFDPLLTPGARNYWKSHDMASFGPDALGIVRSAIEALPTDECEVFFGHVGGAMTRVAEDATAWPNRDAHFAVNVHTRWRERQDDERCIRWARELHRALEPHAMGSVYVNFIPEGDEDDIDAAYGAHMNRLRRVKAAVDPRNLFRANLNIAPAT